MVEADALPYVCVWLEVSFRLSILGAAATELHSRHGPIVAYIIIDSHPMNVTVPILAQGI